MERPDVQVPIPGPESRKIIERDDRAVATSTKTSPVAGASAQGAWVRDADGNKLLDFTSGIGVTNTGHCHPRVVEAIQEQAATLQHFAGTDFYYEAQAALAERLAGLAPGGMDRKVFFTNSGTESIEAAMKMARHHRPHGRFLAFHGAFHGRTLGSLSLTASKLAHQRAYFPTTPGVVHAPFPNPFRNAWGIDGYADPDELATRALAYVEDELLARHVPPEEVAAAFVEPVQGEGGYVVPPDGFLEGLQELCRDHGILLAVDEVQSGFGRTGELFAVEHRGLEPDLIAVAKAIASGMPMGACIARADLDFPFQGAHSNTYGGNLVACAAAQATLDVLRDEDLVTNARTRGDQLRGGLEDLADARPRIGDVRGLGLMLAVEIVDAPGSREPAPEARDEIVQAALQEGLLLLPAGASAIRFIPPLTVTADEVRAGLEVLEDAFRAVLG